MKNETRQAWLWHYMVQNLFWVMFGLIMGSSVYAYDIQSSKLSIHLKYTSVGGSVPSQFVTSNAVATLAGPVSSNYDPAMFACRLTSLPAEVFACKVVHYNPITSVHTLQVRTWDWLSAVEKHNSAAAGTIFSFLHRVETVCEPYGLGHVYEDSLMGHTTLEINAADNRFRGTTAGRLAFSGSKSGRLVCRNSSSPFEKVDIEWVAEESVKQ